MSDKPKFDPNKPFEVAGNKPKFDPSQPFEAASDEPGLIDKAGDALGAVARHINAGVNGAAKWATLGYTPQIAGAGGAVVGAGEDLLSGNMPDYDSVLRDYQESKDKALKAEQLTADRYPVSNAVGAGAGMLMSPVNKVLAPFKAAQGAGIAAKMGAAAKNGVLMGAAMNPGDKAGQVDPLQLKERVENAGAGGLFGGALEGVIQGAPVAVKKGMSTLFGPSEDSINKYMANRERINNSPNLATVKDMVDEQVRNLKDAVEKGQVSVEQAKAHLSNLNDQLTQVTRDAGKEYQQSLPEMRQVLDNAYQELGVQQAQVEGQLRGVAHPREMADDVHAAVGELKNQVVNESSKARDILAKSGDTVETAPLRDLLKQAKEGMYIDGAEPVTPQARAAIQRLDELDMNLSKLPKEIKGESAKKLVQQLDQEVEYSREAGGFGTQYDQTVKSLRRAVDGQLKENPDYAQQMSKVAEKTGLLDQANQLFGTREKAFSTMGNIASDGKIPQQDILQQLGQHTGQDFISPMQEFKGAQARLKNMGPIVEQLPAQAKVKDAELINSIAPNLKGAYVEQAAQESGIPSKISAHEAEIERLKGILGEAEDNAAPYSKWGKDSTQNKLQSLVSKAPDKASIEAGRELEGLEALRGDHGGQTYPQMIEDNRVLNDFSRDQTRGSRNTNIWKAIGGAAGAGVGAVVPGSHMVTVPLGSGAGAIAGGYIDKNGGQIAKGMLDHYLDNPEFYDMLMRQKASDYTAPWLMMNRKEQKP